MIIENKENKIRKLKADEGFVIVSKQKVEIDNKGNTDYAIKSKEKADYITKSNDEDGIVQVIDEFIL